MVVGVDDRLNFSYRFWVVLRDVIKRASRETNCLASFDYIQTIVHALDDSEGSVDAGFLSEGFHEGILPFLAV